MPGPISVGTLRASTQPPVSGNLKRILGILFVHPLLDLFACWVPSFLASKNLKFLFLVWSNGDFFNLVLDAAAEASWLYFEWSFLILYSSLSLLVACFRIIDSLVHKLWIIWTYVLWEPFRFCGEIICSCLLEFIVVWKETNQFTKRSCMVWAASSFRSIFHCVFTWLQTNLLVWYWL